jgi:phosphatidylglycerol---prolipoprotein diacylglyceryl transferase
VTFPVYLRIGGVSLHPHPFFEVLAYASGFLLYSRNRSRWGDLVSPNMRWWVITSAAVGAAVGSYLLGFLEDPLRHWQTDTASKTVVGALIGGWIAVELSKRRFGVSTSTGDLFAFPLVLGIAVGRIGCFLTGLADQTYGTPTRLPWGVDFGDGIPRHPTQLYEIVFLALLALALLRMQREPHRKGDLFRTFMLGYMGWRFVIDFWKVDPVFAGLSAIQWACLAAILFYMRDLPRILRTLQGRWTPSPLEVAA